MLWNITRKEVDKLLHQLIRHIQSTVGFHFQTNVIQRHLGMHGLIPGIICASEFHWRETWQLFSSITYMYDDELTLRETSISGPYFIKVKIILSLKFKINLIFYLIKEFMKHSCLNFFYEIVNKISIKVKRNWNLKNLQRLKDTNSS